MLKQYVCICVGLSRRQQNENILNVSGVQNALEFFARVVNFDVCFRINLVLQVAKSVCRMWRVVVVLSTKYVHVACCTCPRQSLSFAASDVMFMVLQVFYNGFFSH